MVWSVHFDGAARGNPGYGGWGYVVRDDYGEVVERDAGYLGENWTNNEAEYEGLIKGMKAARYHAAYNIRMYGDSQLVINQMKGQWEVRAPNLYRLYNAANKIAGYFDSVEYIFVPRNFNQEADRLANAAINDALRGY